MGFKEKVEQLQRRVGASVDGVVGDETIDMINWALDNPSGTVSTPSTDIQPKQTKRHIETIAVHCSATKEGQNFTAKDIDKWHRNQGWNEIGYNAVVLLDGTIEKGRDEAKVPSHAVGFNSNSIAICYVGGVGVDGKPKDTRTPAQKASLRRWLIEKKRQYPSAVIKGHRDYPGVQKACPSFDARTEYASL